MTKAITQAAIEATKRAVRATTEMADLPEYSTGRNAVVSGPTKAGRSKIEKDNV